MEISKDEIYVSGNQDVKVPAHLNFGKYMFDRIRRYGDKVALENAITEEKLTYKELTQYTVDLSIGLTKLGVQKGDVVAFGSEKNIMFVPTELAIIFTGATMTPHELRTGRAPLKHKLSVTKPKYFICTELFWNEYSDVLESCESIKMILTMDDAPSFAVSVKSLLLKHYDVERFEPAEVRGQEDAAVILYSSGTTGMPKGIPLTHLNCILHSMADEYDESLKTIFISSAGWSHNYVDFKTYQFFSAGRKMVYVTESERSPKTLFDAVDKYKVNIAFSVPAAIYDILNFRELARYNLDSLQYIYSRSTLLHAKTVKQIQDKLPSHIKIIQGYGMTECGELTSEIRGTKGPKPGSVGMVSPGLILKVVDLKTGKCLGPNQQGEICLKGPGFMKGYIDIDRSTYLDEQGFFKTGDMGYYDEDGYFYIVDRLKEIINCGGLNVAPLELETVLQLHPGVKEAGVVGKPDEQYYQVPAAFVVRNEGSTVTEQELLNYVAKEVAWYMQLKGGIKFISKLPRSTRGKILRRELRDMLNE